MPSNPESSSSLLQSASFQERKNFLRGKEKAFGIDGQYRGTAKQNERLKIALTSSRVLRGLYMKELLSTKNSLNILRNEVANTTSAVPTRGFNRLRPFFQKAPRAIAVPETDTRMVSKKPEQVFQKNILSNAPWLPVIYSSPFERNPSTGTTLCSRTAKKNIDRVLGNSIAPSGNARDVHENYSRKPWMVTDYQHTSSFNPPDNANVADIFIDSHGRGNYGHRVVAYVHDKNWYVLDPYYTHWSTEPQLASKYFSMMNWSGKPMAGVAYYQRSA